MDASVRLLWWDRDICSDGYKIRDDVREAAHMIWARASQKAEKMTGDTFEAVDIMERAVLNISLFLDRRKDPLGSQRTAGLLMVAFTRDLNRTAAKLRRVETAGGVNDLELLDSSPKAAADLESRIDRSRFIESLSATSQRIWCLRDFGCNWEQIAQLTGMSAAKARTIFWRDLHRVRASFENPPSRPKRRNIRKRVPR
jgi:hypothetical protein